MKNRRHRGPVLDYFHPARIALNKEVREHPALLAFISSYHPSDFAGIIGEIAAYCNVVMDGMYSEDDLNVLCDMLYWKLKDTRKIIIH